MTIPIEAVDAAYYVLTAHGHGGSECEPQPGLDATARAALVAARPYLMPTREEIVTVIGDALWFEEHPGRTGAEINNVAADAVLALLNGAKS